MTSCQRGQGVEDARSGQQGSGQSIPEMQLRQDCPDQHGEREVVRRQGLTEEDLSLTSAWRVFPMSQLKREARQWWKDVSETPATSGSGPRFWGAIFRHTDRIRNPSQWQWSQLWDIESSRANLFYRIGSLRFRATWQGYCEAKGEDVLCPSGLSGTEEDTLEHAKRCRFLRTWKCLYGYWWHLFQLLNSYVLLCYITLQYCSVKYNNSQMNQKIWMFIISLWLSIYCIVIVFSLSKKSEVRGCEGGGGTPDDKLWWTLRLVTSLPPETITSRSQHEDPHVPGFITGSFNNDTGNKGWNRYIGRINFDVDT